MPTSVTMQNIITGACSSFKVDTVELGATQGGVTVSVKDTFLDISPDQFIGVLQKTITKRVVTVVTTMEETSLANLKIAWNLGSTITTGTGISTLGISEDKTSTEHTVTFIGPGAGGATRTFAINRAIGYATGNLNIQKDKDSIVQVTFECMVDPTKPVGQEYGTLTESSVIIAVTGITLNKTTDSIAVSGTDTLIATVSPSNATDKSVAWSSDSAAIATVDSVGEVTGVSAGTAHITCTSNSDNTKTASCTVTVA